MARQEGFTFVRRSFPKLPEVLETSNIEVRKTFHFIDDCWRVDVVNLRASKQEYRSLAYGILTVIFRPDVPSFELRVTNPKADVKLIQVSYPGTTQRAVYKYLTQPHSFEYQPEDLEENPWTAKFPERGIPEFRLLYSGNRAWEHWEKRDRIEGFGNDDASIRLATMLLNFGAPNNRRNMVRLETLAGYGGVSRLSPEMRFHLPDSKGWPVDP